MTPVSEELQGAARIMARLHELAKCSSMGEAGIARLYLSPEQKAADRLAVGWMEAAGLVAKVDAVGNVHGRLEGTDPAAKPILLGSHLDTVVDAGAYDGCLGVVTAIEVMEHLRATGRRLRHPVEILGFADEEGVRFGITYLGSTALAGGWPADWFERRDAHGLTVRGALLAFGLDPEKVAAMRRDPGSVAGYLELHIEQGPTLDELGLPLARVTAIAAVKRWTVRFHGFAGHAGTVPMGRRHDAGCAAAEFTLALERIAEEIGEGVVATTGQVLLHPNVVNCIPGEATVRIDLRAPTDALLVRLNDAVMAALEEICTKRSVTCEKDCFFDTTAIACDALLTKCVGEAVEAVQGSVPAIPSGAGHDAAAMSALCPMAMIFLRCRDGVSHSPLESITSADAGAGLEALARTLLLADERLD
ncbi:Zn-dependent hydrolase [Sutterella sp.]|uniref:Zn-dependent hydrolase n=1 Tax=Sutterella sp. TaxID=1981025 RepID=UPI0026E1091C|nr:Zn-dependent hydrolase [Sutterella sp.]MDO5531970.1 Zn-dependent hydrolase [Sutterella sp.]